MIEKQFLVVLLYLIKTILILRELIQHSSLRIKSWLVSPPWVQGAPCCCSLVSAPSQAARWTCRMGCAGGPWVCAVSILTNICSQVPCGSPGRASDSPTLLFGCKGHLSLFKRSFLSCSLPSVSLCFFPHQFFIRVFHWWGEPLVRLSQPACSTPVYPSPAISFFPNSEFTVKATLAWSEVLGVRKHLVPSCGSWAARLCCPEGPCREAVLMPWVKAQDTGQRSETRTINSGSELTCVKMSLRHWDQVVICDSLLNCVSHLMWSKFREMFRFLLQPLNPGSSNLQNITLDCQIFWLWGRSHCTCVSDFYCLRKQG